jgi:hypothetical protein
VTCKIVRVLAWREGKLPLYSRYSAACDLRDSGQKHVDALKEGKMALGGIDGQKTTFA